MKLIVANWKMNGGIELVRNCIKILNPIKSKNTVVVCPPFELIGKFQDFKHHIGAQNCACVDYGAFTGETSAAILHELGCEYVIIGHSERRNLFGETDEIILKKWETAKGNNLIPILCVGEEKNLEETLNRQLNVFLLRNLKDTIIAYEPIWSIGTGNTPSLEKIDTALRFIKKFVGLSPRLLYGGSVNLDNIEKIIKLPIVDGVLIGSASLNIMNFREMIKINP